MLRECLTCNKIFTTFPSRIKAGIGRYCSNKCRPSWANIIRECLTCKKSFKVFPSRIERGEGKYCSKKCSYNNRKNTYCGKIVSSWKGDSASLSTIHKWIQRNYGKPKKCQDCGTTDPNKKYEWANISGKYHRDIKDFKRLCVKCHKKFDIHLRPRGENHGCAKLTEKDVIKIRKLYIPKKYTRKMLSKEFNVSCSLIEKIIYKVNWIHI